MSGVTSSVFFFCCTPITVVLVCRVSCCNESELLPRVSFAPSGSSFLARHSYPSFLPIILARHASPNPSSLASVNGPKTLLHALQDLCRPRTPPAPPRPPACLCLTFSVSLFHVVFVFFLPADSFISLDASRPWMIYWILHSLDLLDHFPEGEMVDRTLETVLSCQVNNQYTDREDR